jgi:hypothetical protein
MLKKSAGASECAARDLRETRDANRLDSHLVSPVPPGSFGYPTGVFSSCATRAGQRNFSVQKEYFRNLLEARSHERVCHHVPAVIAPLRCFLSRAPVGSRRRSQGQRGCVDTQCKQKIERGRVDRNEQGLHRSLGQLILTKLAQRQIHTRPSETQNFSFAVARYRGGFNSVPDLSEV